MSTEVPPEAISLPDAPTDGITALSYLPDPESASLLASTSFDGAVRLHDTRTTKRKLVLSMESGPLLSLATPYGLNALVTGGSDGTGKRVVQRVKRVFVQLLLCCGFSSYVVINIQYLIKLP